MNESRQRHLTTLIRIALLVAAGDYVTKDAAVRWVSHENVSLGAWLQFAVVPNERAAFGLSLGAYTWHVNLALTLAAIIVVLPVARDLARIDRVSTTALGLIAGGALGNLASLLLSPRGVIDFIAVRLSPESAFVLNVADVAAYVGLALMVRTGLRIVSALRAERRASRAATVNVVAPAYVLADREVARVVFHDHAPYRDGLGSGRAAVERPVDLVAPSEESGRASARILEFPVALPHSVLERQTNTGDESRQIS